MHTHSIERTIRVLLAALVGGCGASGDTAHDGGADERQRRTFVPDDTSDFINPERGWMERYASDRFEEARRGDDAHPTGYSVVWSSVGGPGWDGDSGNPFRLDNYRDQPLPASLVDALSNEFAAARSAGIKLKVRFAYNYSGDGEDTTRAWILMHVSQLSDVLTENADTIGSLDAGFVGKWGEMHSSSSIVPGGTDEEKTTATLDVVRAILAATPPSVSVSVRYPRLVRGLFGEAASGYELPPSMAFDGSDQARIGWYNDCLWSNRGNTGTYRGSDDNDGRFELDRDTFEAVGRYAATTGESCDVGGLNEFNSCDAVLADMAAIGGPDTLLRGFWETMYERFIAEGCYDEVTRRLGYRLQLSSVDLPVSAPRGGTMDVTLELRNTGFGKVYNARPLELVFVDEDHEVTVRLTSDARRQLPLAGQTSESRFAVDVPADLVAGRSYRVYLRLPDPSPRLEGDVRYAIRLANAGGLWDPASARHDLGATVLVR